MKRTLTSLVIIGLVALMAGTGTYAWFTSTATSTGNTFTAGTLDMYLTNTVLSPDAQWCIAQKTPGDSPVDGDIRIHNTGSMDGNHIQIEFGLNEIEDNDGNTSNGYTPGPDSDTDWSGTGDMAKSLQVVTMSYTVCGSYADYIPLVWGTDGDWDDNYITNKTGNNYIELDDLRMMTIDNLPVPKSVGTGGTAYTDYAQFDMTVRLIDTGEPQNDFQGDVIEMTVKVTLNQDGNQ